MASVSVKTSSGSDAGSVDLDEAIFGIEPNIPCMHQVVTAQLAARRSGTQSTKTRSEARGGGAKPWKQKGTGRARQGSIRAPQWKGGGVALGPKPRSYAQRTPKKMIRLALRSALSDRAAENQVIVLDSWGFDAPSTKAAVAVLDAVGAVGPRVLVVLNGEDLVAWKSFRNLPNVHLLEAGQLNAYDVLVSDVVVFTRDTLPTTDGEAPAKAKTVREAKPKAAAPKPEPEPETAAPVAAPAPAVDPAETAAAAAETDTADTTDESDASAEADDMGDLPNRPPADPNRKKSTIEATDRVKSAADKPDPRFEAARQKASKEDALRARAADAADAKAAADAPAEEEEAPPAVKKSGGFSFSNTDKDADAEDDQ